MTKKEEGKELEFILTDKIRVNPKLVFRKWINKEKFEELRESVRARGVIEPVIVRSNQGESELILGLLRYLTAKEIGLKNIPALYRDIFDQDVLLLRIDGNNQQELNPFDEALYIAKLVNEFRMTIKDVARELGRGLTTVNERIKLLSLREDIQKMVFEGDLSLQSAIGLTDLPAEKQKEWANIAIEQDLSAAELYALVKKEDISRSGGKKGITKNMAGMKINLRLESLISYLDKIEKAIFNLKGDELLAVKRSTELLLKRVGELQNKIQGRIKARRAA